MDFQKEREACKAAPFNDFGLDVKDFKTVDEYFRLLGWLAAKAQAVSEGFVLVPVAVVKRYMSHISIATCHPNNTKQEELVMNDDMEFLEKAMLEAAEGK